MNADSAANLDTQRIDRWLHHVCLFKTRSQATKACEARQVKVNGETIKAAKNIRINDTVTIRYPNGRFIDYRVLGLAPKSIPKKTARELYDLCEREMSEETRELVKLFNASIKPIKRKFKGRPTKKERRRLVNFHEKSDTRDD
ncbi:hypothetical protein JW992_10430 [candidate division KSB1 bacterium]|nr:hypothetical protein [candidate division KSB1 bacterium]